MQGQEKFYPLPDKRKILWAIRLIITGHNDKICINQLYFVLIIYNNLNGANHYNILSNAHLEEFYLNRSLGIISALAEVLSYFFLE